MLATQYNNTVREARSRSSPKPPIASVFTGGSLPNQLSSPKQPAPLQPSHYSEPQLEVNANAATSTSPEDTTNAEKDKQRIAQYVVDLWDPKGENSELEALKKLRQLTLKGIVLVLFVQNLFLLFSNTTLNCILERNLTQMRHAGVVRICSDYIKKYDVNPQQPLHPLQQHSTTLLAALVRNGLNPLYTCRRVTNQNTILNQQIQRGQHERSHSIQSAAKDFRAVEASSQLTSLRVHLHHLRIVSNRFFISPTLLPYRN